MLLRPKRLQRYRERFRHNDGITLYWLVITVLGSLLSIAVLPFDFRFLDAPVYVPIMVRVSSALGLAAGAALPAIFKENFSTRIFPWALIVCCALMSATISYLETFSRQTMYYNALYQLFVAFAFMRVSLVVALTIYALPVLLYYTIAGQARFDMAQPEILLLAVIGFAANQGLRAADARRLQRANHETLVLWARSSAHELKGPLITIRMIAMDLLHDRTLDDRVQEAAREIHKLCNRGLAVQSRILMNARYHSPDNDKLKPMYAGENIREALAEYEFRTPDQSELIHLEVDLDFEFNGDPRLFRNVIHNLIANSLRAIMETGSGKIYISVGIDGEMGRIDFRDTGPGIAPEQLRTIFTPGVTFSGGTGFGLAFCKAVIESFGGTIRCESRAGEYTKFTMLIPPN